MRLNDTNISQLASALKLQAVLIFEEGQAAIAKALMQRAVALEEIAPERRVAPIPVRRKR